MLCTGFNGLGPEDVFLLERCPHFRGCYVSLQVDKHIRRLDSDLSRFEQELKMKDPGLRRTSITSVAEPPTPISSSKSLNSKITYKEKEALL